MIAARHQAEIRTDVARLPEAAGIVDCSGEGESGELANTGELTSTGSAELDALLGGGIERGTSLLLIGSAGVGKSSIALTYAMAAAAREEKVSVFAFDEGLGTVFARATGLGMALQAEVDSGRVRVQQIDPAEMAPGEFAYLVRASVEKEGDRRCTRCSRAAARGRNPSACYRWPD